MYFYYGVYRPINAYKLYYIVIKDKNAIFNCHACF